MICVSVDTSPVSISSSEAARITSPVLFSTTSPLTFSPTSTSTSSTVVSSLTVSSTSPGFSTPGNSLAITDTAISTCFWSPEPNISCILPITSSTPTLLSASIFKLVRISIFFSSGSSFNASVNVPISSPVTSASIVTNLSAPSISLSLSNTFCKPN